MSASRDLLKRIRDRVSHPATMPELMHLLGVPPGRRRALGEEVERLVEAGLLVRTRDARIGVPEVMSLIVGRWERRPGGRGVVVPERRDRAGRPDRGPAEVLTPGDAFGEAMPGDRVLVRLERQTPLGPEGRVVRILERAHARIVGRFETDGELGYVVPFDRRVATDVQVPAGQWSSAEPGEMVVVAITRWPTPARGPLGRVTEVLGRASEPGVDTEVILRKYGISGEHTAAAVADARRLGTAVTERDLAGRTDFRGVTTVTIDGEHARDFDDAITIERIDGDRVRLGVHIADVAHYVAAGSALDEDARERATSVYFPERAVHMFPADLATGLCSLNPHVDRLVQSCVMEVNAKGAVVRYELHDGVIHSDARMTYTAVNVILTDRDPVAMERYAALVPMFELMRELYEVLRARRRRRGAIDFDLPEAEVLLSAEGEVEAIVAGERNVAHRLIEEFMLLANETVAAHLQEQGVPALHRVHEAPDAEKVAAFETFIASLGYGLGAGERQVTPRHFQRLLDRIAGTPEERPIAALMLRTMQKARYDAASLGHFGLAATHYTHFTSPIRRYPDLIVHRMLRESRGGALDAARREELAEELPELARHTSDRERRADEAERELLQWKKVRFMADKVGDVFDGYVTGVAQFGLFIELVEHYVEGMVHISTMADDFYRFLEHQHVLKGENTRKVYRLGDRVSVQVVRVDLERRKVELALTDILDAVGETGPRETARRGRAVPG
ncbi:MAG: ribonuclease R, partial [Acidimicrobiia bacterium]|nr:ribonuclease R [Acidimicrobiia bacterium]